MLQHIDTMIGFAVVMLFLSLLITVLVQGVIAVMNLRGLNLLWGLKRLLAQISQSDEPEIEIEIERVARAVLTHPTVSHAWSGWMSWLRYARAIRSDEIVKILGELAERAGVQRTAKDILDKVGVRETNAWVSALEHELDKLLPAEAEKARQVLARAKEHANGGRDSFKEWYDTVMDRTSERFVTHTRVITLVCAAALSFGLSIDAGYVFERMSADAELHVKLAQSVEDTKKLIEDHRAKAEAATADDLRKRADALAVTAKEIRDGLELPLIPRPPYHDYWRARHLLGMFATMLLLSLGAPFWFNLLQQLANLRPIIAGKVDKSEASG